MKFILSILCTFSLIALNAQTNDRHPAVLQAPSVKNISVLDVCTTCDGKYVDPALDSRRSFQTKQALRDLIGSLKRLSVSTQSPKIVNHKAAMLLMNYNKIFSNQTKGVSYTNTKSGAPIWTNNKSRGTSDRGVDPEDVEEYSDDEKRAMKAEQAALLQEEQEAKRAKKAWIAANAGSDTPNVDAPTHSEPATGGDMMGGNDDWIAGYINEEGTQLSPDEVAEMAAAGHIGYIGAGTIAGYDYAMGATLDLDDPNEIDDADVEPTKATMAVDNYYVATFSRPTTKKRTRTYQPWSRKSRGGDEDVIKRRVYMKSNTLVKLDDLDALDCNGECDITVDFTPVTRDIRRPYVSAYKGGKKVTSGWKTINLDNPGTQDDQVVPAAYFFDSGIYTLNVKRRAKK